MMAFCNKFGSMMRQTCSLSGAAKGEVSMASMLNTIRCMSSAKLFVGGLSWGTDDQTLREAFSAFGDVTEARIITDRDSGRSRGFGFVSFSTDESANSAMSAMDGQELHGRNIRVNLATNRPSSNFGGGGDGYTSRNFGGGDVDGGGYRRDGGY